MSYVHVSHFATNLSPKSRPRNFKITSSTTVYESPSRQRYAKSPYSRKSGKLMHSPERHRYAKKLASNPHPFGRTIKKTIESPVKVSREITSTGRKDQFDETYGEIYDCKLLGDYDEVPKYRWDGGFRDQVREYSTPEQVVRKRLFDENISDSKMMEGYYS